MSPPGQPSSPGPTPYLPPSTASRTKKMQTVRGKNDVIIGGADWVRWTPKTDDSPESSPSKIIHPPRTSSRNSNMK